MAGSKNIKRLREPSVIGLGVPTEKEILENPRRQDFLGGGWIDSLKPNVINVYWHRRQGLFTVYSLLQVLEHETLHCVLIQLAGLQVSMKLDKVHCSSCVWIDENKLFFVNEFWFKRWVLPQYFEEPTEDLLE
ncbi:MAG TPA: hypothetical protein VEH86_07510 [Candidatus Acidoferrum sp.]|nr:hypothetical protein [Candidatus Acidoferrum sp.]